jgi:nucleolin
MSLSARGAARLTAPSKRNASSLSMVCRALAEDEPTAAPATESTQVYIGNISWDTDEETLASTFEQFGAVERCNVVMDANGRSRGFAFVTYGSIAEAESAIDALNQTDLDGRTIRVDKVLPAGERPEREERAPRTNNSKAFIDSPYRLYVGNLPWRFDDYDLEDAFGEFGEVQDAKVMYDRDTGRSRGFGFVTLNNDEEVDAAIDALDGADVDGRTIRVNRAKRD